MGFGGIATLKTAVVIVSMKIPENGAQCTPWSGQVAAKKVQVQTNYGPVSLDIISCDGPQCAVEGQEDYLVGWYHLKTQGIEVATWSTPPGPFDFCSLNCLHKAAAMMTGN